MKTKLMSFLLGVLVASQALAQGPSEQYADRIYCEVNRLAHYDYDMEVRTNLDGIAHVDFVNDQGFVKIHVMSQKDAQYFAQFLVRADLDRPAQLIMRRNMEVKDRDEHSVCTMGFCYEDGVFTAQNFSTYTLLSRTKGLSHNGKRAEIKQDFFLCDDLAIDGYDIDGNRSKFPMYLSARTFENITIGTVDDPIDLCVNVTSTNCLDSANGKKELNCYAYMTMQKLFCQEPDADGVKKLCIRTPEDMEANKACNAAWRKFIREVCNNDNIPDNDIGPEDKWVVGHVPDMCAGGDPAPGGCFLPQFKSCNSAIATACTNNPGKCYKDFKIKLPDGTVYPSDIDDPENPCETEWVEECWSGFQARKAKIDGVLDGFPLPTDCPTNTDDPDTNAANDKKNKANAKINTKIKALMRCWQPKEPDNTPAAWTDECYSDAVDDYRETYPYDEDQKPKVLEEPDEEPCPNENG